MVVTPARGELSGGADHRFSPTLLAGPITRAETPPFASSSAAANASGIVMPAATIVTLSDADDRSTLLPPTGNVSSAP